MLLNYLSDSRIFQTDEVKESCGGQYASTFVPVLSQEARAHMLMWSHTSRLVR